MDSKKQWAEIKTLTNEIHSCQSAGGVVNKKDRAEAVALERQRSAASRSIAKSGSEFLKSRGFTAGGLKLKR